MARARLKILSTAESERDIASLISEPCFSREASRSLLTPLQQTTAEDAERIIRVVAPYLKSQDEQWSINVGPLLVLIRSQRDKTLEEILAASPPVV